MSEQPMNLGSHYLTSEEIYSFRNFFHNISRSFAGVDEDELVQCLAKKVDRTACFYNSNKGVLEAFLDKMARNMARDMLRKMNQKKKVNYICVENIEIYDQAYEDYCNREEEEEIEAKLGRIQRAREKVEAKATSQLGNKVFAHIFDDGYSRKETARLLGVDVSFVDITIHNRVKAIRKIVLRESA